jgi:hypothetical protein
MEEHRLLVFGNRVQMRILWHIDPLLRNDRETDETTAVDRQRTASNNLNTVGIGVFYVVRSEDITPQTEFSECSAVEYSGVK